MQLSFLKTCRRALQTFRSAREGNVAVMFAFAMIPMVGLVGAAVDYSRANSAKSAMQAALDSATLMLSKEATGLTEAQRQQKANDYFRALLNRPELQNIDVKTPVYGTTGGSSLQLTVTASVKSDFMAVMGVPEINLSSSSIVKWGNTRLRVALGLDNTGSMLDYDKIGALKTATKSLLNSLQNAATRPGDVYVSIVPFSRDVNVLHDSSVLTADWLDWTEWENVNGSCSRGSRFTTQTRCLQTPACSRSSYTSKNSCEDNNGTWYTTTGTWTKNDRSTWQGCVKDRDQSYDTNNTTPISGDTSTPSTRFRPEQYEDCPASLLPLTYDWQKLKDKVDALYADGNTNQTIGLQWAWQSLTGDAPLFAPAIDTSDGIPTKKIIILLTDGLNTQNRWTNDREDIDARTELACTSAKAADIVLYTVQVNTGNDPLQTSLQNCASPESVEPKGPKFFLLTSGTQVVTTFNQIGTALSKLRLAQ
jgi:Flp pilus assembly protein TadG